MTLRSAGIDDLAVIVVAAIASRKATSEEAFSITA